ncbi:hypothetical protein CP532_6786 [Ophiocordyceps camponoti-leonardi (nom. inval.)]|nr:hypothetical protein CP532_6786 [Ophiocordyceps camponoti-leonardi (nom. inval.)]
MVLGLLAITAIPTITGVGQAVSAQKKQNAAAKEQAKFYMTASVASEGGGFREIGVCVLRDGKLLVEMVGNHQEEGGGGGEGNAQELQPQLQQTKNHKFCGYYFTYPSEEQHRGLVSTIADDPPMLNWIYVNRETGAVEHGGRKQTLGHVIGPWGWSRDESFLTLDGVDEGFVVREEEEEEEEEEPVEGEGGGGAGGTGGGGGWAIYREEPGRNRVESGDGDEGTMHRCIPVKLRRKPLLRVDSCYVRGHEG